MLLLLRMACHAINFVIIGKSERRWGPTSSSSTSRERKFPNRNGRDIEEECCCRHCYFCPSCSCLGHLPMNWPILCRVGWRRWWKKLTQFTTSKIIKFNNFYFFFWRYPKLKTTFCRAETIMAKSNCGKLFINIFLPTFSEFRRDQVNLYNNESVIN